MLLRGRPTSPTSQVAARASPGRSTLCLRGSVFPRQATARFSRGWPDVSEDGLTTFHLRDGVTFSDGSSFDAADAVHSINRVLAQSARKSQLAVISTVRPPIPPPLTVARFRSARSPCPPDLSTWMVSEASAAEQDDGTSPYTLDTWTKGSTLAARPARRRRRPQERPSFHYYTDATAMTNALSAGDIDIVPPAVPGRVGHVQGNSDFVAPGTSTTKELLAFGDAQAPFKRARAPGHLGHRPRSSSGVHLGRRGSADRMVSPSDPWYGPDLVQPLRSRALVVAAGRGRGWA